ncbi:zinc finger protein 160 isoform X2 [Cololabis saira]|uniref:zinc finger protein 160 isoform X2 n=1 Tax=Cololabis saira TaxID=129043 RepID=UPI002AD450AB|nr:zinc finger protein 160 isoform X2 [Cololabis saira]
MENCGFQSQLLSVVELLAKAAAAEISRRVDDSCALLRLELSQCRRDIELLKSKCEVMEGQLRTSPGGRKMCSAAADETSSDSVTEVFNKESAGSDWDGQVGAEPAESAAQCQQHADVEPVDEAELMQIKRECAEGAWRNELGDKQSENLTNSGPLVSPADIYDTFPEQQLHANHSEAELVVKQEDEEEPSDASDPFESGHDFVPGEVETHLWPASLCRDSGDPCGSSAGQQIEQIPTALAPQTSLHLEDIVPRIHSAGKSHSVLLSAARVKRRARTFGCKRLQPEEGHNGATRMNSFDSGFVPQQSQHQYRDTTPQVRSLDAGLTAPGSAVSLFGQSRGAFSLAKRVRAPWRAGLGEKSFSCTYCSKGFTRFSQLKEHLRSHTGEKPFSCMQCGRSFTKQCNLIRHAVVHSGEKPYECSLCGKCFTQRSSLKSHQQIVH